MSLPLPVVNRPISFDVGRYDAYGVYRFERLASIAREDPDLVLAALEPGHTLLLNDGKVRLVTQEASDKRVVTRVEVGGALSDRKGVSLPDTTLPFSALAAKDRSDLEAALDAGVDWVGLSFIQRPEDIAEAKKITRGRAGVMAVAVRTPIASITDFTKDETYVGNPSSGFQLINVPGG